MTQISCRITENKCVLQVEGHANYARQGADIVCSAVSILSYTIAESIENIDAKEKIIDISDGHVYIEVCPLDIVSKTACLVVFNTILTGFKLLAESYPDNVQIV